MPLAHTALAADFTVSANTDCTFADAISDAGGDLDVMLIADDITPTDSAFNNNTGNRGNAMFIQHGRATLSGTSFSENHAAFSPDIFTIDAEVNHLP